VAYDVNNTAIFSFVVLTITLPFVLAKICKECAKERFEPKIQSLFLWQLCKQKKDYRNPLFQS
jgi:hypothetical protein